MQNLKSLFFFLAICLAPSVFADDNDLILLLKFFAANPAIKMGVTYSGTPVMMTQCVISVVAPPVGGVVREFHATYKYSPADGRRNVASILEKGTSSVKELRLSWGCSCHFSPNGRLEVRSYLVGAEPPPFMPIDNTPTTTHRRAIARLWWCLLWWAETNGEDNGAHGRFEVEVAELGVLAFIKKDFAETPFEAYFAGAK